MINNLDRKKRMLRVQKSILAKAEMDYSAMLRAKDALHKKIEQINALTEGENMAVRVFPILTYNHLKSLTVQSHKLDELAVLKRDSAIKENRKVELFAEAVASARNGVSDAEEVAALSDIIDRGWLTSTSTTAPDKLLALEPKD